MPWFPNLLEPEDETTLSGFELKLRRFLAIGMRFFLAVFMTSHLFDFLFSSVWMHGYIWSLNLPIDMDMTDKPAGAIVRHQLEQMGQLERVAQSILTVLAILMILIATGFCQKPGKTVWDLFRISLILGSVCGFVRPVQMKQRFFSSLHEGFYSFFLVFVVSMILTLRLDERFSKVVTRREEGKEVELEKEKLRTK